MRIVGLMSGTSADGIDAALVEVAHTAAGVRAKLLAFRSERYPASMRRLILAATEPASSSVELICHLHTALAERYARAVTRLLTAAKAPAQTIHCIGSHGQTVWHNPRGRARGRRFAASTLQLGDPSIIAQRTGITTVGNFRAADIAVGGEGAPLTPLPHAWLFGDPREARVVLNLGGIGNLTLLSPGHPAAIALAFDSGPANMVLDGLVQRHSGGRRLFDRDGRLAARGRLDDGLLRELLRHPFFRRRPPRSTGREMFGGRFIDSILAKGGALRLSEQDLLATATELTAASIEAAVRRFVMPQAAIRRMILCGGGARNTFLVHRLQERLAEVNVVGSSAHGVPEQAVEAVSFALLAYATMQRVPGNVPAATGAKKAVVLGVIAGG